MSGGVDSSVSAALLKNEGHDVTGVFIKVWQPDWIECTWREDRRDAMRAAAHLDIPFVTLDLEKEYKKGVIDYMIAEYAAGRTPNPDVMCNKEVKFGAFYQWAMKNGGDAISTGHYAQITKSETLNPKQILNSKSKARKGLIYSLLKGVDSNKDQSYFLWTLRQEQLGHILFPVGGMTKPEVRRLAKKFKLPNAEKKDSQGLCFIGHVDIQEFLSHYIENKPGKVVDGKGRDIGTHPGALFFTLGERHGFLIDSRHKTPNDEPYYVIGKNMDKNEVAVSQNRSGIINAGSNPKALVTINSVNWIGEIPIVGTSVSVRTRYRQPLISAKIVKASADSASFELETNTDPITPGQSLVIYDGKKCLGGGVIN